MVSKRSTEGTVRRKEQPSLFDVGKGGVLILISLLLLGAAMFVIFGGEVTDIANPIKDEIVDPVKSSGDGFEAGTNVSEEAEEEIAATDSDLPNPATNQPTEPLGISDEIVYTNPAYNDDRYKEIFIIEEIIKIDDNWYELHPKDIPAECGVKRIEIPYVREIGCINVWEGSLKVSSVRTQNSKDIGNDKYMFIRASFKDKNTGEILDIRTIEIAKYTDTTDRLGIKESGQYLSLSEIPKTEVLWQWEAILTTKVK